MIRKTHLRCECGRAYPKKLMAQAFWTPAADAELMRLRDQGLPYRTLAIEINKRHAIKVTTDQVYYRHLALCEGVSAARTPMGRSRPKPSAPVALKKPRLNYVTKPEPEPVMAVRHSNSCADALCTRQRANGYDKCLGHLPPLEITKGETV